MVKRFRLIAGPNGSGKSTLVRWLGDAYKVNFYSFVNADDIFALVAKTGAYSPKFPISKGELVGYAERSTYGDEVKDALPYLSRAFVFDNSGSEMDYLGQYEQGSGWTFSRPPDSLPRWLVSALSNEGASLVSNSESALISS